MLTCSYARADTHTAGCVTSHKVLHDFMLSLSFKANVSQRATAHESNVQTEITRRLKRHEDHGQFECDDAKGYVAIADMLY